MPARAHRARVRLCQDPIWYGTGVVAPQAQSPAAPQRDRRRQARLPAGNHGARVTAPVRWSDAQRAGRAPSIRRLDVRFKFAVAATVVLAISGSAVVLLAQRPTPADPLTRAASAADGSLGLKTPGVSLLADPGSFDPQTQVEITRPHEAPERLADGAVATALVQIRSTAQPRIPVQLRLAAPPDFRAELTLVGIWEEGAAAWTPLHYEAQPDGDLRVVVPHFSTIGTIRFENVSQVVSTLVASQAKWLSARFGVRTCAQPVSSERLRTLERRHAEVLAISVRDEGPDVVLELCNPQSFYVEYWVSDSGAHQENDLIAPGRTRTIRLDQASLPPGASLEVLGTSPTAG